MCRGVRRRRLARPEPEALEVRSLLASHLRVFPIEAPLMINGEPSIISGPDGNLWFTEPGIPDRIGRLTPIGDLTEFPLASNNTVSDLVKGPDGNIWFIQPNSDEVGRITPSGAITEFPLGGTNGDTNRPTAIAAGPDGNIWVAEYVVQNQIGPIQATIPMAKITPAGTITQLQVAEPVLSNYSIDTLVAGPDGDLWFGGPNTSYIGQLTTNGNVSYTDLSNDGVLGPGPGVYSIAQGANGDLWFLASTLMGSGSEAVGHITSNGLITVFPTMLAPGQMVLGPDGNLWITQHTHGVPAFVIRVTPSGSFSRVQTQLHPNMRKEYPLATASITNGAGGNLWIMEVIASLGRGVPPTYFDVVELSVSQTATGRHGAKPPKSTGHHRTQPKRTVEVNPGKNPFGHR